MRGSLLGSSAAVGFRHRRWSRGSRLGVTWPRVFPVRRTDVCLQYVIRAHARRDVTEAAWGNSAQSYTGTSVWRHSGFVRAKNPKTRRIALLDRTGITAGLGESPGTSVWRHSVPLRRHPDAGTTLRSSSEPDMPPPTAFSSPKKTGQGAERVGRTHTEGDRTWKRKSDYRS